MKNIYELDLKVFEDDTSIGTMEIEAGTGSLHISNGYGDGRFQIFLSEDYGPDKNIDFRDYGFRYAASFEGNGVVKKARAASGLEDIELDGFYSLYTSKEYSYDKDFGAVVISRVR